MGRFGRERRRPEDVCRRVCGQSLNGYGFVVWLEPANSLCPVLANTMERALPSKVPSFARVPSIVTSSPIFTDFGVHPFRRRALGLPSSNAQFSTFPDSVFTST